MPQNNLFCLNQGPLLYKGSKKLFYDDYFILSLVLERSNPPSDIKNHIFDECEVLLYRPKQDIATGIFKGLYKTIEITLFINKKVCYESCACQWTDLMFTFLPSTTGRTGKINRYFSSLKLLPMDVSEESFNIKKMGDFF